MPLMQFETVEYMASAASRDGAHASRKDEAVGGRNGEGGRKLGPIQII